MMSRRLETPLQVGMMALNLVFLLCYTATIPAAAGDNSGCTKNCRETGLDRWDNLLVSVFFIILAGE